MIGLALCGGFARRMLPLTENQSKALLPIAGKPIIEYIVRDLEKIDEIKKIYISTNNRFEPDFKKWLENFSCKKEIKLVVEPTLSEGEKLGAVGGWGFLIENEKIDDDLLSISGDNLTEFSLQEFIDFFQKKKSSVFGVFDVKNLKQAKKFGIVELDKDNKIIGFEEKPEKPKSTLASTGIYFFKKDDVKLITKYLEEGNSPDKPGDFIIWLYKKTSVYGFSNIKTWFDIGSFESYKMAGEYYSGK